MSRDICAFQSPRHRVFQNNQWQLVDTPFEGRTDPPLWLADLGVWNVLNYIIPAQSATRQWQVRGGVTPTSSQWTVKFRLKKEGTAGTLFSPTLMENGLFITEVSGQTYLAQGTVTWGYFEGCSCWPQGDGKPVAAYDALRLTVS